MYGKVFGAMIGAIVALFAAPRLELAQLALFTGSMTFLGAVLGHFTVDRSLFAQLRAVAAARRTQKRAPAPGRTSARVLTHHARRKSLRAGGASGASPRAGAPRHLLAATGDGTRRTALADALVPLFVAVARADEPLSAAEATLIRAFFERELGFDARALAQLQPALVAASTAPEEALEALARAVRPLLPPAARVDVVRWLYDVALADGDLALSERAALRRVVETLNLSDEQLQEITRRRFGEGLEHYRTLGLAPSASDDDIRGAFRRLAAEHHPDRASAHGGAAAHEATQRFRALKDAYDALRLLRGF